MKRLLFFAAVLLVLWAPLWGDDGGYTSSTDLSVTITSIPEAKIGLSRNFAFPFLRGEGMLTQGNNISATLTAELSPISLNGVAEIVWTPVAFFQLVTGGRIGSGWNITLGDEIIGIGKNVYNADGTTRVEGSAFGGLLWNVKGGAVLQFDTAALWPGDWHHIVFHSYHEINYAAYTAAKNNDSWYFENDSGENRNGFNYYGNYLLGYQMPLFLDMVGILAEENQNIYNAAGGEFWGDDLSRWTLSALLNFKITDRMGITLLVQSRTMRNFTPSTKDNEFYQDRQIVDSSQRRLEFFRVAATMKFKLR
ncbi:hypothetical protein [Leadbettera azotonutricia]|uniref:Uncharacterized protein n=1 Tax=Leadbettera azotonutricia (strain ATCC BAA-888 / DSM 13862 / ZAS-9) TaxID=545695 RepID=F5Y9W6_LEAAZ|nr:hypothetical protein [Leadbettera azotonutricia]AEF80613.1 conserved hypothetical protein [Leadbettera azotonutricia ZAS-9]